MNNFKNEFYTFWNKPETLTYNFHNNFKTNFNVTSFVVTPVYLCPIK